MRGYTVHLLFHLVAITAGATCGIAAGLWWFGGNATAPWLSGAALALGVIVLVLQGLYIAASGPPTPSPPRDAAVRSQPRMAQPARHQPPAAGYPAQGTLVQPGRKESMPGEQDTKTPAFRALQEFERGWSAQPPPH